MKTPGVYIVEKNAFPNSVVEVATAVPAFIGYTEKAKNGTKSLINLPSKISSLAEYEQYFGGAPTPMFNLKEDTKNKTSFIYTDFKTYFDQNLLSEKQLSSLNKAVAEAVQAETAWKDAPDGTKETDPEKKEKEEKKKEELKKVSDEKFTNAVTSTSEYLDLINKGFIESDILSELEIELGDDDPIKTKLTAVEKAIAKTDDAKAAGMQTGLNALIEVIKGYDLSTITKYYSLERSGKHTLYHNLKFFFANGGGPCYIISVGGYNNDLDKDTLINAIDTLLKEQEPTMVLVPEAVNLSEQECYDVQNAVADHCGKNQNRITIMNIYNGYKDRKDPDGDFVDNFRTSTTTSFLNYSTAYYPWLNTSIVSEKEISFENIAPEDLLKFQVLLSLSVPTLDGYISKISLSLSASELSTLDKIFSNQHPLYGSIMKEMLRQINLLPPAAAMAGIYTLVDNTKEVWKAPANIGISNVISPAVNISHAEQEDLNVPLNGKAVNAIRYFVGDGIKVWGARTLDGNSLDWRYINVRRTMIMLEESIKNATKAFVFDPNTANTWVSIRSMINNFLNGIWKRGGLAGAVPDDAFSVHIGLGETMTPEDILEGILRITVLVAVVRPAEFIEITFQQQMQKS